MLQRYAHTEPVLPRLLAHGQLEMPVSGLSHCYVSKPFGQHLEESMPTTVLLSAMKQLAEGLARLGSKNVIHRCVSNWAFEH